MVVGIVGLGRTINVAIEAGCPGAGGYFGLEVTEARIRTLDCWTS